MNSFYALFEALFALLFVAQYLEHQGPGKVTVFKSKPFGKMASNTERTFRIKKQAPEDGWGYVVSIGLAVSFACPWGSLGSFGLMFNDFIKSCGGESGAVTVVIGFFASSLSFAGLLSSILFKKFSIRSIGIFGALLYFLGSLLTIFVTSVEQLIVTYSIMQGSAIGVMVPVAYTTFNSYFIERRVLMMSFAQTLVGVGTMIYPMIVHFLMEKYGFRGMIIVVAAMNSHAIFGMLVMQPVSWHYKITKVPIDEDKTLINSNGIENDIKLDVISSRNCDKEHSRSPQIDTNNDVNVEQQRNDRHNHRPSIQKTENGFNSTQRRVSSLSVTGFGGVIVSNIPEPTKKDGIWRRVADFMDLSLLKDPIYLNIVLGISFAVCSDGAFFTLQPMYMFYLGFSSAEAAIVVAAGAAADLCSRIFVTVVSLCIQIKARHIYLAGVILTILLRFVFLKITDFIGMIIITAVMSFVRTWLHLPQPLVFADHLPPERFASGFGQFMFLQGNLYFMLGPVAGWIRDVTQSYVVCFHSLSFIMALCAVPWIVEILWLQMCKKSKSDGKNGNIDKNSC